MSPRHSARPCAFGLAPLLALGLQLLLPSGAAAEHIKLSQGFSVMDFEISPHGKDVVYRTSRTALPIRELWTLPTAGGVRRKLSNAFVSQVDTYQISPDGMYVVYTAYDSTGPGRHLWSTPLATGGLGTLLNGPLAPGGDVNNRFRISPDSSRVVYTANEVTGRGAYSVPLTGGARTFLSEGFAQAGLPEISPDGGRVAFWAGNHLHSMPVAGGARVELHEITGNLLGLLISPDSTRAVFWDNDPNIYSVPLLGGAAVQLNAPSPPGFFADYGEIGAAGSRVLFRLTNLSTIHLFSAPLAGGTAVQLNPPGMDGGFGALSPDGSRVVYRDPTGELLSVPITGGAVTQLEDFVAGAGHLQITPDSRWVVFVDDEGAFNPAPGYRVPIQGGSPAQMIWSNVETSSFEFHPNSRFALVRGTLSSPMIPDETERLWLAPIASTPNVLARQVVPKTEFQPLGNVSDYAFSARGDILFRGDLETDGLQELYAVPLVFADGFESGDISVWDGP